MTQLTLHELFKSHILKASIASLGYRWNVGVDKKEVVRFYEDLLEKSLKQPYDYYNLGNIKIFDLPVKEITDGEQRLTTSILFIAALLFQLRSIRILDVSEIEIFEDVIKSNFTYKFSTIYEDNSLFKDYVIDRIQINEKIKVSKSGQKILSAFDYFTHKFEHTSEIELLKLLQCIVNARCLLEIENIV